MSFDADFYIENVLPILNRDGNRLIGSNFTYQQDGAKSHTSKAATETIKSMGFSLIGPNSPDLNPLDSFLYISYLVHFKMRMKNCLILYAAPVTNFATSSYQLIFRLFAKLLIELRKQILIYTKEGPQSCKLRFWTPRLTSFYTGVDSILWLF